MSELQINNTINATIDLNSIVSIGVARAERSMQDQLAAAIEEVKTIDASIADYKKQIDTVATNFDPDFVEKANAVIAALKQLNQVATLVPYVNYYDKEVKTSLVYKCFETRTQLAATTASFSKAGVSDQVEQISLLEQRKSDVQSLILNLRKKLSNIGSLERAVRGQLAEAKLREAGADGEALIQAVLSDLDGKVKALPGF